MYMSVSLLCVSLGVASLCVAVFGKCTGRSGMCEMADSESDCDPFFNCVWSTGSPSPVAGHCSGSSGMCKAKSEADCDPFFKCSWTGSSSSSSSSGSSRPAQSPVLTPAPAPKGSCGPGIFCEGQSEDECKFFSSCSWNDGSSRSTSADPAPAPVPAPPAASDFCKLKTWSGDYCSGRVLVTCGSFRDIKSQVSCDNTCEELSQRGEAVCKGSSSYKSPEPTPANFCYGRMQGTYCNGRVLVTCGSSNKPESEKDCGDKCTTGIIEWASECGDPSFCTGGRGLFCDGQYLVECDGLQNIKKRTNCEETTSGTCMSSRWARKDASCGNPDFCEGKMSGRYCDGETRIITCNFPSTIESTAVCPKAMPCKDSVKWTGEAMCGDPDVCNSKLDGTYCDGNLLVTCRSFGRQSLYDCTLESTTCQVATLGGGEAGCGNINFCKDKLSGDYCETEHIMTSCMTFNVATRIFCPSELKCSSNSFQEASCGQVDACFNKLSGWYCFENSRTRYQCSSGSSTPSLTEYCGVLGCSQLSRFPGQATCGDSTFCDFKLPGTYCEGQYLVTCKGLAVQSRERCIDEVCTESSTPSKAACGTPDFCQKSGHMPKIDGTYCEGNFSKACVNGEQVGKEFCFKVACNYRYDQSRAGKPLIEGSGMCGDASFCDSKDVVGTYCDGSYLVTCSEYGSGLAGSLRLVANGAAPQYNYCGSLGCSQSSESINAGQAVCGASTFCLLKTDGAYCESASLLSQCSDGKKNASVTCAAASCKSRPGIGAWCSRVMHKGQLYGSPCDLETGSAVLCRDGVSFSCTGGRVTNTEVCLAGCSSTSGACCQTTSGSLTLCQTTSGGEHINGTRIRSSVMGPDVCADDASFKDANGKTCNSWAGEGCTAETTEALSASDVQLLQQSCPKSCGMCGSGSTLYLTGTSFRRRRQRRSGSNIRTTSGAANHKLSAMTLLSMSCSVWLLSS
eukprot:TRINITY_DN43937_c0_g1_i1.p1 TRINITY_DN43937_c0_g1~~TRINITY_DN43937_c0_g1_i1.p1  ORF type:complete len:961 (-),score=69.14 TRINITY_DN43937_c0_g1_i1:263-3145(-)